MRFHASLIFPLLYVSPAVANYADDANNAIKTLQDKWYDSNTGLWGKTWWQSGNIVETLARFGKQDSSFAATASSIIANTYAKSPNEGGAKNWKNDYYDDMGWWALGWIASYDLTGDAKYLATAKDIFEDMTGGWTTPCGGGIWWDKKKTSIASISNELFLSVAAHLANRSGGDEKKNYLHWAQAEWDWFSKSGVINSDNVINDGIHKDSCKNEGDPLYTYNQGVVLGGLAELARATGDGKYIDAGRRIFEGTTRKMTVDGILTENGQNLDEQGAMFKGAFIRGLAALNEQAPYQEMWEFIKKNADSAWSKDKNGDQVIGPNWKGDGQGSAGATSHASGVDLLVAAAQADV